MNQRISALGTIAVGLVTLHVGPARAQASSQDIERLLEAPLSETRPWADLHLHWDVTSGHEFAGHELIGAKYFLLDNLFVDFDPRFRDLNRPVSDDGQGLATTETGLTLAYRF